jgi:hypothetical protein
MVILVRNILAPTKEMMSLCVGMANDLYEVQALFQNSLRKTILLLTGSSLEPHSYVVRFLQILKV